MDIAEVCYIELAHNRVINIQAADILHLIARISGLDPANPPFFPSLIYTPLNKNDAKFVDIIHTDARLYGAPVSTGTVDFWPNGGITLQPGCPFRFFIPLTDNGIDLLLIVVEMSDLCLIHDFVLKIFAAIGVRGVSGLKV